MNWYKHIPLQRKILAACLVVILVPLTILVSLVLRRSMEEEIDRSIVNMTQANEMYKAIPEIRRNRFTLYRLSV